MQAEVVGKQEPRESRGPCSTERRGPRSRGTNMRQKIVTMVTLVFESISVLNSSPTRLCSRQQGATEDSREWQGFCPSFYLVFCLFYHVTHCCPSQLSLLVRFIRNSVALGMNSAPPAQETQILSGFTIQSKHSVEFFHLETEMTTSAASYGPFFCILEHLAPEQASLASCHGHHSVTIIRADRQQLTADLTSVLSSREGTAEGNVAFLTDINSLVCRTGK